MILVSNITPLSLCSLFIMCQIQMAQSQEIKSSLPFQVNREICQSLNISIDESLNIADQPERAADDSAVAPADLPNSMSIHVPHKISIPVQLTVKSFSQFQNPVYGLSSDQGTVGQIDIDTLSGKIYYNDQPLFDEQKQKIKEACHHMGFES